MSRASGLYRSQQRYVDNTRACKVSPFLRTAVKYLHFPASTITRRAENHATATALELGKTWPPEQKLFCIGFYLYFPFGCDGSALFSSSRLNAVFQRLVFIRSESGTSLPHVRTLDLGFVPGYYVAVENCRFLFRLVEFTGRVSVEFCNFAAFPSLKQNNSVPATKI